MSAPFVVFVSSRGALAALAGVPSVERHVEAGRTLGLDVVVVFPPERRALGAEVRGFVHPEAACIPADQLAGHLARRFGDPSAAPGEADANVLVVAAEWYLSLSAIAAVRNADGDRAFGRVCERGCVSVPVARISAEEAVGIADQLGTTSAAAALGALPDASSLSIDLEPNGEQRLSDNVSIAHAEDKLIQNLFGPPRFLPLLRLRPTLAPVLARRFNDTAIGPAAISTIKLAVGLLAAWVLGGGTYANGLAGAGLYFFARLIGASGIVLARASLADGDVREKLDLAGDTVLHLALLWSLAGGAARDGGGVLLAAIATVGLMVSTGIAYVFVLRQARDARKRTGTSAPQAGSAVDELVSRFVQRDGVAYALLFAAVTGTLDLFLWAAALASHLFWILWLLLRPRREDGAMALGRSA